MQMYEAILSNLTQNVKPLAVAYLDFTQNYLLAGNDTERNSARLKFMDDVVACVDKYVARIVEPVGDYDYLMYDGNRVIATIKAVDEFSDEVKHLFDEHELDVIFSRDELPLYKTIVNGVHACPRELLELALRYNNYLLYYNNETGRDSFIDYAIRFCRRCLSLE